MIPQDRDKVRIRAILMAKRGEAFTAEELSKVTGIPPHRIVQAGDALVKSGLAANEENYYWVQSGWESGRGR